MGPTVPDSGPNSGPDSWPELAAAAAALATGSDRAILGIVGPPGAGKSVFAQALERAVQQSGIAVATAGMDGFHLAGVELARLGRTERKGAPDTFDAAGYVNLLRRLRAREDDVVYAPRFDRGLEEPVAGAVPITRDIQLVITEGNYLLTRDGAWADVRALLEECWYIEVDEPTRLDRLVARHVRFGRSAEQARERAYGSDQRNARIVIDRRADASRIVRIPT